MTGSLMSVSIRKHKNKGLGRAGESGENSPYKPGIAGGIPTRKQPVSTTTAPKLPIGARAALLEGSSVVGGGSCADSRLGTVLLALESDRRSPNRIEEHLRSQHPPIIGRLENDKVLVDLRTVFPSQEKSLREGLIQALS